MKIVWVPACTFVAVFFFYNDLQIENGKIGITNNKIEPEPRFVIVVPCHDEIQSLEWAQDMYMSLEATTRDEVEVEADLRLELRLPSDDTAIESTVKNGATLEQIQTELKAMTEYSFRGTVGRRDLYELQDTRTLEVECGNRVFMHSHPPKGVKWKWKLEITNLRALIGDQRAS